MKAIVIEGNCSIPLLTVCYKSKKKAEKKSIRAGLELQLLLGGMVPSPESSVISVRLAGSSRPDPQAQAAGAGVGRAWGLLPSAVGTCSLQVLCEP